MDVCVCCPFLTLLAKKGLLSERASFERIPSSWPPPCHIHRSSLHTHIPLTPMFIYDSFEDCQWFFVCGMLCWRKITGWYFPSFPDVFIIYRFFWGAGRFSICWLSLFSLDIFFSKLLIEIWFKTPIVAFNRKMQWNYSFTSIESKAFILDVSNLLSHNKT